MGRYFGGRFGDMLSPTSTIPNTKAILSMRDHYYMKKIAGGGLADPATTIAELDNVVSWSAIPNEDHYTSSAAQGTYYNGTRHKVMYGTGTVDFDSYEYPMYGKFDIRGGDTSKDSFFQLYAWQGIPANFTTSATEGTLFQMGVYWESSPNTDYLTNTLEATTAVADGDAAYFVTSGYGTKTWSFYTGGSNSNSEAHGSTARDSQATRSWSAANLTFVCYGDNSGSNANKVKVFHANTLWHTFSSTIGSGRPVYIYLGLGYPSNGGNAWSSGLPKFRYGNCESSLNAV